MQIDLTKANAAIDEYLAKLRDPNISSRRIASNYYTKVLLEQHGVIPSARALDLTDHCVLFTACVIACRRLREVSRTEVEHRAVHKGHSLERSVRLLRSKKNSTMGRRLEKHLADTKGEVTA